MEIANWNLAEKAKVILESLILVGLFLLLFFSHMLKLAKWACEEYEEFILWWEEFKGRRRSGKYRTAQRD